MLKIKKVSLGVVMLNFLIIGAVFNLSGCQDVEPDQEIDLMEYGLNTSANRQLVLDVLQDKARLREVYEKNQHEIQQILRPSSEGTSSDNNPITTEELLNEYESCGSCSKEHNDLLIPLFRELLETSDEQVIEVIGKYENRIESSSFSNETKSDLYFVTFTLKVATESYLEDLEEAKGKSGFWDCFGSKVGRNVSEGIVGGFVTGCILGAKAVGAAGTVVLPVLGTVTGAVAGCMGGGGMAAITGAIAGVGWSALKCVFN